MSLPLPADRWSVAWPLVAAAAGLAVALQLWGLYVPRPPSGTEWFPGADKVQHGVIFGLPVALVMLADTLRRRRRGLRPRARVLVIATWVFAAHAVVSELIQHAFYADRVGDPLDVLADWSGIVVGGLLTGLGISLSRFGGVRRMEVPGAGGSGHG